MQNKLQFYGAMYVARDFLETFDIQLVAGRDFDPNNKLEPCDAIIVNEAMAQFHGWTNQEAIGRIVNTGKCKHQIVGVVKNFNVNSLHNNLVPFALILVNDEWVGNSQLKYIAIKAKASQLLQAITFMKLIWEKYDQEHPFEFSFLKNKIDLMYNNENKLGRFMGLFALLMFLISSIGILGLSAFMTTSRTKEIGIRKILGSSNFQIIKLISLSFLRLILVANLLAWPIAYWALNVWLNAFISRTEVIWWYFPLSGAISLFFSLSMVIFHAYRSAQAKPVQALRYE